MSKPRAKSTPIAEPIEGRPSVVRFALAVLLVLVGIGWITWYYLSVRAGNGPAAIADLGRYNYLIGFGLLFVGLALSANPATPMGRGRGVVIGMLGCFLLGLLWICFYYVISNNPAPWPVFNDLQQYNLLVGIGFMGVGFAFATRWE